jgi:hypothetical protein
MRAKHALSALHRSAYAEVRALGGIAMGGSGGVLDFGMLPASSLITDTVR